MEEALDLSFDRLLMMMMMMMMTNDYRFLGWGGQKLYETAVKPLTMTKVKNDPTFIKRSKIISWL